MTAPNRNLRFAYADYKSVPESMDKRYELLDGDLVLVPTPTIRHQRVSKKLGFILITFFEHNNLGEVLGAPLDVVFGKGDEREVVQPDIIFISNERKDIATEQEIQGAPDLVVEILSPGTEQRDRNYKKSLYSRYNVLEYWIVGNHRYLQPNRTGTATQRHLRRETNGHLPTMARISVGGRGYLCIPANLTR